MTARGAAWLAGAALLALYVVTLAPGVTFWDAGELIAAAHGLGIPHPPGTPLYVALGRAWTSALGGMISAARAMNLLSAVATALAGALMAWLVARRSSAPHAGWLGLAAAVGGGTMMSVWSNATETEVYALSLLHSVAILVAASHSVPDVPPHDGTEVDEQRVKRERHADRWLLLTAYLVALAPAVHLSALIAVPAAIVLAGERVSRDDSPRRWRAGRMAVIAGAMGVAAGVGRADWWPVVFGCALLLAFVVACRRPAARRVAAVLSLALLASSALLILLVRARHDPSINQGDPSTLAALLDVIGRRQYAVASLLPRQAAVWWQAANLFQYLDWQVAMSWGNGLMTSPARVIAALAWLAIAWAGHRALRRDSRALADMLAVLFVSGTVGVALYLNMRIGASLGWGFVPEGTIHEARERDYFFVLGFWAWGCLAGYGAVAVARQRGWPAAAGLAAMLLPLAGNWTSADRSSAGGQPPAARQFAAALLENAPRNAVLFLDGDNDSYPVWYLQEVEGVRRDVLPVTVPLLPAAWYPAQLSRRTGWRWESERPVQGARTRSEQQAALIAEAGRAAGRPIATSPALSARERALLGKNWVMRGPLYVAGSAGRDSGLRASIDSVAAVAWLARAPMPRHERAPPGDDVVWVMLSLLQCPRLALDSGEGTARRDSLEVRCNLR